MSCRTNLAAILLLGLAAPAWANNEVTVANVPSTTIPNVLQIEAPLTTCAAVNDALDLLVLGYKNPKGPQLTFYRLDAAGKPIAPQSVSVTLPKPGSLSQYQNYPLSLVFHPKLPLLYVWQDGGVIKPDDPPNHPGFKNLEHLFIYDVQGQEPKLLQNLALGDDFAHGNLAGSIALDAGATRLYVPNVKQIVPKTTYPAAVGYYRLNDKGLVTHADPKTAKPTDPLTLVGLSPDTIYDLPGFPCGLGFLPISDDVVIVGGCYGPVTWDMANRRARCNGVLMSPLVGAGYHYRIVGHPTLPVVFSSMIGYYYACRIEHADGYLTLAPQRAYLEGVAVHSAPVVLAKSNQLAIGCANAVIVVNLDEKGRFTPKRTQMDVQNATVNALAYSEKHDRLYVPVEKVK